jgi:hypothetical protein
MHWQDLILPVKEILLLPDGCGYCSFMLLPVAVVAAMFVETLIPLYPLPRTGERLHCR